MNNPSINRFGRVVRRTLGVIGLLFVALVIYRIPFVIQKERTAEAVAKIHATKLQMADVMGENLPPEPDPKLKDATVAGIDANENGIRDDVELAIFAEYPNSVKIRAVLLQYALALQMEFTQEIVNERTVTIVAEKTSRGDGCIADAIVPRKSSESPRNYSDIEKIDVFVNFVENKQINTEQRKIYQKEFYRYLGSYTLQSSCDIDYLVLSN